MAAITCLHPYQNTRFIASELDAFRFDAEHRRGLSANTLSPYRCDLLAAGTLMTGAIDLITLAEIESYVAARNESSSTSNRHVASLRQFFRWVQRQGYHSDNPIDLVEAKRDGEKLPRPIKPAISKCSIRRLLLPHNLPIDLYDPARNQDAHG
jgi:site-specific recombinase XerD